MVNVEQILHSFTLNFVNQKLQSNYAKQLERSKNFAQQIISLYNFAFYLTLSIQIISIENQEERGNKAYSGYTFSIMTLVFIAYLVRRKYPLLFQWIILIQEIVYIIFITQYQFTRERISIKYSSDCNQIIDQMSKQETSLDIVIINLIEKISGTTYVFTMLMYLKIILSIYTIHCWYIRSMLIFIGSHCLLFSLNLSNKLYVELIYFYLIQIALPLVFYNTEKQNKLSFTSRYKQCKDLKLWKVLLDKTIPSSIFVATMQKNELSICYLNETCRQCFNITNINQFLQLLKEIYIQDSLSKNILQSPTSLVKKNMHQCEFMNVYEIINSQLEISKQMLASIQQQQKQNEPLINQPPSYTNLLYHCPYLGKEELVNCYISPQSQSSVKDKRFFDIKIVESIWNNEAAAVIVVNEKTEKVINERIREIDLYKDQLLQTITHNLKTPLNGMIMFLQASTTMNDIQLIKKYIDISLKNSILLNEMISDLLDYSQINRGKKLQIHCSSFDIEEVIHEVSGYYQYALEQKKVQLNVIMNVRYLDDLVVYNDVNRFKQILHNLLGNAVKFTFNGYINIQVDQETEKSESLKITVIDTGIGINEEIKKNLFCVFGTFDEQRQSNQHGVGIGLAICQKLVQLLGPSPNLTVESKEKEGSSFSFYIYKNMSQQFLSQFIEQNNEQGQKQNQNGGQSLQTFQILVQDQVNVDFNSNNNNIINQNGGGSTSSIGGHFKELKAQANDSDIIDVNEQNENNVIIIPSHRIANGIKVQSMQQVILRNQQVSSSINLEQRSQQRKSLLHQDEIIINPSQFKQNNQVMQSRVALSDSKSGSVVIKQKHNLSDHQRYDSCDIADDVSKQDIPSPLKKIYSQRNSLKQFNNPSLIKRNSLDMPQSPSSTIQKEKQQRSLFTDKFQEKSLDKSQKLEQLKNKEKNKCKEDQDILIEMIKGRFKILVVDDTQYNCLALRVLFGPMKNVEIEEAYNGEQALEKIQLCKNSDFFYTLILMDVNMPVMDGLETTAIIKNLIKQNEIPDVPIITVTAYGEENDKIKCLQAGADDHIQKPITYRKMIDSFQNMQVRGLLFKN